MISFPVVSRAVNRANIAPWGLLCLLLLGGMGCTINVDLGKNRPVAGAPGAENPSENRTPGANSSQPNAPVTRGETSSVPSGSVSVAEVANTPDDTPQLVDGGPMISLSTRYQNQRFSSDLYEQIPWWGEACTVYPVKEVIGSNVCTYSRDYEFADGLLLMAAYGTEGAVAVFRPHQPMTVEAAKKLGWILSKGEVTQNRISEQNETRIVYDETSPLTNSGPTLTLDLEGGQVVKILFGVSTP
ncbi:hypothetical protein K4A83_22495 [Spirulina subsalsa FACHB-351]|uniref:Uncharacterized protein n=1 Tax=Spirulina subsalsa FACHB-351 TaxID=234711 RepID=A0ABT3LBX5_9CYAN|nr:hypothetical protein [Spirulina subsalsa]MCW6039000.1 hypothetical protein [Spirulina subsalsa FACHB-351]